MFSVIACQKDKLPYPCEVTIGDRVEYVDFHPVGLTIVEFTIHTMKEDSVLVEYENQIRSVSKFVHCSKVALHEL
jgi:hypothetical protein